MVGKIYISGQIGTFDGVTGVELIDVIGQVKKQPESISFEVHINSEGGLVDVGFDIYHYLKSLGKPITTIGAGIVASIATIIFMAGSIRQIRPGTPFMIHLPWGGSQGTAEEIEYFAEQLKAVEKKLLDFYKKELDLSEEALRPLLREETWLTEDQLASLGFTNITPLQIAAKARISIEDKPNNNKSMTKEERSWLDGMFAKLLGKKSTIVNKVVQDASGASIDFTDLADDATIEVGQKATIDGNPAEGEHVMPDGTTYVFTAGELTEIKPEEADVEESADLAAANARVAELETEVETITARATKAESDLATMKTDVLNLKKQVYSKFNVDGKKETDRKKDEGQPANRFAEAREKIKNLKHKQK